MIKTFESFNIDPKDGKVIDEYSNEDIKNILSDINLLYNNSIDKKPHKDSIFKIVDTFLKDTRILDWLLSDDSIDYNIVPNFNLEKLEKINIVKLYNKLYETYNLEGLPDIDDIDDILIPIRDFTKVEIVIEILQENNIILILSIDTIPSINAFPSGGEIEINFDKYDEIVSEIKPAVDRIKSLGYKVVTKLCLRGEIKLLISR